MSKHPKIQSPHLALLAYVYIRQSSPQQVVQNLESQDANFGHHLNTIWGMWNVENCLSVVTNTTASAATRFYYDGDGNRTKRVVSDTASDATIGISVFVGNHPIAKRKKSGKMLVK